MQKKQVSSIPDYLGNEHSAQIPCIASHHSQQKETHLRQPLYAEMTLDVLLFLSIYSRSSNQALVYIPDCAVEGHECLDVTECFCCDKTSKRGKNLKNAIWRYQTSSVWRLFILAFLDG